MHAQILRKTGYATGVRLQYHNNGINEIVSIVITLEPVLTKILKNFSVLNTTYISHIHT